LLKLLISALKLALVFILSQLKETNCLRHEHVLGDFACEWEAHVSEWWMWFATKR